MVADKDWEERRVFVLAELERHGSVLDGIAKKVDLFMNDTAGRMATIEERVKWVAFGVSSGVSLVVSLVVGAVMVVGKSLAMIFMSRGGG